jgi:hypothetical protein
MRRMSALSAIAGLSGLLSSMLAEEAPVASGRAGAAAPRADGRNSWDAPAIVVSGRGADDLHEDELIGTYGQPRWTASENDMLESYVLPEGQCDFNYWLRVELPSRADRERARAAGLPGPEPRVVQMYEAEFGIGYRLQIDLNLTYAKDGGGGTNALESSHVEARYALADWGGLWGNPAVYVDWEQAARGADEIELKLLLCDVLAPRWRWISNVVVEAETGGAEREVRISWNAGVSYTIIDQRLRLGVEEMFAIASERELLDDGTRERETEAELLAGPALSWKPTARAHVDLYAFIGLTPESPQAQISACVGWEF